MTKDTLTRPERDGIIGRHLAQHLVSLLVVKGVLTPEERDEMIALVGHRIRAEKLILEQGEDDPA